MTGSGDCAGDWGRCPHPVSPKPAESAPAPSKDARELAVKIRAFGTVDTGIGLLEEYLLDEAETAAEIERYVESRLASERAVAFQYA